MYLFVSMTKHVQAPHVKQSHKDNDDVIGKVLHSMVPRCAFLNRFGEKRKGPGGSTKRTSGICWWLEDCDVPVYGED